MGCIYNQDRWNEFSPVRKLFNKGDGLRVTYTVNKKFYKYLTSLGVKSYDTLSGKSAPHEGDDIIAIDLKNNKLPRGSYQVMMPFDSMVCTEVTRNVTETIAFRGYDDLGNKHEIRIAHGTNPIVKVGEVYGCGDILITEYSKGLSKATDDHVHVTYKVNGQIRSIAALLSGLEPFPYVTAEGNKRKKKIDLSNEEFVDGARTVEFLEDLDVQNVRGDIIYHAKKGEYLPLKEHEYITRKSVDGNKWVIVILPDYNWGYFRFNEKTVFKH